MGIARSKLGPFVARSLAGIAVVLGAMACNAETEGDVASDQGQAVSPSQVDTQLAIPLTGSPLAANAYEFCSMDRGLNLPNSVLLAWMSANAYGDHFGTWQGAPAVEGIASVRYPGAIFSAFRQLGFGNPGEDALWTREGVAIANAFRDNKRAAADELSTRMFTRFDPSRGMGKLHGTNPAGYKDGNQQFSSAGTQVYFLHNRADRTAIVAFRGTQPVEGNRADIYADLDYNLVNLDNGSDGVGPQDGVQVHRGFRTALFESTGATSSIERRLLERIKTLPAGTQVFITGHSLGGALANVFTLLALRAQEKSPYQVAGLVTFGSPEVGNAGFGAELRRRIEQAGALHQRFVYGRDPVPRVVQFGRERILLFRELDAYQHATRVSDAAGWPDAQFGSLEVQLPCVNATPPSGALFASPVPSDVARCASTPREVLDGQADHAIRNYYDALVRALRQTPRTHPAQQCRKTTEWRSACRGLVKCLSESGGTACASPSNCAGGLCDDIRRCESDGNGGWSCFDAYCGESPRVAESVRTCWAANGGWGCFR
jgi:hypothetical protein